MLITDVPSTVTYIYAGVNEFPIPFSFYGLNTVKAGYRADTAPDSASPFIPFIYGVDYAVTGVKGSENDGDQAFKNGQVTLLSAGAEKVTNGNAIVLIRETPFEQQFTYNELDNFPAKSHENGLSRGVVISQELSSKMSRALMLPPGVNANGQDLLQTTLTTMFIARDMAVSKAADAAVSANAANTSAIDAAASAAGASAAVTAATAAAVTAATVQADRAQSAASAAEAAAGEAADEVRGALAIEVNRASSEADRAQSEADRAQMEANHAQNLANVGPATSDKLGFVKIGEGIAVTEGGIISVPPPPEIKLATKYGAGTVIVGAGLDVSGPTEEGQGLPAPGTLSLAAHLDESGKKYGKGDSQFFGHVKLVDDFEQNADATSGISISPKGVKTAFDRLVGIIGEQVITSSRTWVVPETGRYQITAVGGGGNGGAGGKGISGYYEDSSWAWSGGGGGGGGAGERTQTTQNLTKGTSYVLTVGGVSGTSSFGALLTARGGGNGGNGEPGGGWSGGEARPGNGGAGGASYGSAAGGGAAGKSAFYGGGGGGGGGATSYDGYYGNGGSGGRGATASENPGTYPGSGGSAGRQGCIKIKIVPV